MKKYFTLLFFLLLVSASFAQIGGRTQVAVMNLDASGIEQSAIIALSDRLRMELLNTGRFDVMERNRMDMILKEQGLQQSGACNTTECVVQVGQILGVERMISGSVGKVGRIYTLFVQMVDIETGRIIMSKSEDCDCPIEKVLTESIRNVALKMAGLDVIPVKTAFLTMTSIPNMAEVYVDNSKFGTTPINGKQIEPGSHEISVRKAGYNTFTFDRQFFEEKNSTLHISLKAITATQTASRNDQRQNPKQKEPELKAKKSGFPWLWVGLGAAAVGGGAVYLLSGDKQAAPEQTTGEIGFRVSKNQ